MPSGSRAPWFCSVAACFAASAGCSKLWSGHETYELRASEGATATPEGKSIGCGKAGQRTGDFHVSALDGLGRTRDYELLVPAAYDPRKPLALSFVFHGAGGDQAAAKGFGLQGAAGAAEESIFVFPQGVDFQKQGVGWDDACSGYDVALFDHVLAAIESNYCVDTKRVFAAGFSWGGDHVTALACCRGAKVRAIVAASCTDEYAKSTDPGTYLDLPCPSPAPVAIRFTHQVDADPQYATPLFATTSALYRSFARCAETAAPTSPAPCRSFDGCASPFIECAYPGLGHTRPPGWADESWAFLSSLR
jgi:poly(3-hydroxybutyrate) depolymerase